MLYDELKSRGLIYQDTSENLRKALETPLAFYCGVDPTADTLHLGSLLPLIMMRRLQLRGHKPILLLGGATGMIGDPSGKSKERVLMDRATIEKNAAGIFKNAQKVLDFSGPNAAVMVNNMDWMENFSFIDFLRDIGKHFSVNAMLAKDSVKMRIENRDQGISYTEFSYMLLQSYDYYFLNNKHNCQLQIGGSDQWGNITSGIDLIRRMQGDDQNKETTYGLTFPLVTKSDGGKFGKSESGNIWLSRDRTSPYQFYQYFLRLSDEDVVKLLKYYSLKPLAEIEALSQRFAAEPHKREAHLALADELTALIHSPEDLAHAKKASEALFSGDYAALDEATLRDVFSEAPSIEIPKVKAAEMNIVDLLVETKLCTSKGNARKDIAAGAIYLNNNRHVGDDQTIQQLPLLFGSLLVVRKGKKNYCLARIV